MKMTNIQPQIFKEEYACCKSIKSKVYDISDKIPCPKFFWTHIHTQNDYFNPTAHAPRVNNLSGFDITM